MIETGMVDFLKADPALTALIGDRLDPFRTPQGKGPTRLTYYRVGTPQRARSQDGPAGPCQVRIQLDTWGEYREAKLAMDRVRQLVDGYRKGRRTAGVDDPELGASGKWGAFTVQSAWLTDDQDEQASERFASDVSTDRVSADLMVWFVEQ